MSKWIKSDESITLSLRFKHFYSYELFFAVFRELSKILIDKKYCFILPFYFVIFIL